MHLFIYRCSATIPDESGCDIPETIAGGLPRLLFCLAPDWVCLAPSVTLGAVSSYLAISPLPGLHPRTRNGGPAVYFLRHFPLPETHIPNTPAFTRNPARWCPDFPFSSQGREQMPSPRRPTKYKSIFAELARSFLSGGESVGRASVLAQQSKHRVRKTPSPTEN